MNSKQRVLWNSLSGVCLFLVSIGAAFVVAPVLIHGLGNRDYSVWELVLGFLAYFRILDLGVAPALVRYIAHAAARNDSRRVQAVHHSAMAGLAAAAIVSFVAFALISTRPEPLINVQVGDIPRVSRMFLLTGGVLAVQFFGISFSAYLQGMQKHFLVNTIRGLVLIAQSIGFYYVATHPGASPLVTMAEIYLAASLLEYGTYACLVLLGPDRAHLRPWLASRTVLRELYVFGLKSFNLMVAHRIRRVSLPFVITHTIGVSNVVYFSQPGRLVDYAMNLTAFLYQPLMPYFTAISSEGDLRATRSNWFAMSRALQFFALFVALGIYFLGVPFIQRWLGEEYAREGYWVVKILALGLLVDAVASTATTMLVSLNQHGRPSALALAYSVVTVVIAVPLAARFGVTGAALALATTNALTSLTFLNMACTRLQTTLGTFLARTAARFLVPVLLSGGALWYLETRSEPTSYGRMVQYMLVASALYLVSGWFLGLRPNERSSLRRFLARS